MLHIDHVCIASQNLYEAAARLRRETGLASYDGGWFAAGMAVRIVPLGNHQYLEVESVIDARRAAGQPIAEHFLKNTASGADCMIGWCLRVDTLEELQAIAARIGTTLPEIPVGARLLPDGTTIQVFGTPNSIDVWPTGRPNFLYWPQTTLHPGHGRAEHWVQPTRIAWMELGGEEGELRAWIGDGVDDLPLRFVGGTPGIKAVAVATVNGEIVIRR